MKKTLILFAVLYGFASFGQEENTSQIKPVSITAQKQSTASNIKAMTISVNNNADNNDSKAPIVNIIATKSNIPLPEKATLSIAADNTTLITKASNVKTIYITAERSLQPQTLNATLIKSEQKQ